MLDEEQLIKLLLETFQAELEERLAVMDQKLLALEKTVDESQQEKIINDIFREAHSLKGSARSVNQEDIEKISHKMENLFSAIKNKKIKLSQPVFDLMYKGFDLIKAIMGSEPNKEEINKLISELESLTAEKSALLPPKDHLAEKEKPLDKIPEKKIDQPQLAEQKDLSKESIRVSTGKLNKIFTLVEEQISLKLRFEDRLEELQQIKNRLKLLEERQKLVNTEINARYSHKMIEGRDNILIILEKQGTELKELVKLVNQQVKKTFYDYRYFHQTSDELQDNARSIRMMPVSTITDSFQRMVRDIAKKSGKEVELVVNSNIEVDKEVLENLKDPLNHLIRNAIDHGIETPLNRKYAGKDPVGRIEIDFTLKGDNLQIEIKDNGEGIDIEKIKKTALKRDLIKNIDEITDKEALALIFQTGFSTSPIITDISGRGLGLDIVRKKVEDINGLVDITTNKGKGTSFILSVPHNVITLKGLLLTAGGRKFVVPTSNIEKLLRLEADKIYSAEGHELITYNNEAYPLTVMQEVLGLKAVTPELSAENKYNIIILRAAERKTAFYVDSFQRYVEITVKKLGSQLRKVKNILGASVLSDGNIVLVLNPADLIRSSSLGKESKLPAKMSRPAKILLAEDTITTRILQMNILENAGYQVEAVGDGLVAWERLQAESFDLVVTDVEMPKMNGFELTARLKNSPLFSNIPVILVTTLESDEYKEKGIQAGADAYIIKRTFEQENLLETIKQLI